MSELRESGGQIFIKGLTCNLKFSQPAGILYYLKSDYKPSEEWGDGMNRIEINTAQKIVQLESHRVSASFTREQYMDLKKGFGMDITEMLRSTLNKEMEHKEDKIIYDKFLSLGQESEIKGRSKFQSIMNKWIGFVPKVRIKDDSDISLIASNFSRIILKKTRVRAGDFLITNSLIGSRISDCQDFVYSNTPSSQDSGITQIGTIRGIRVFINPSLGYQDLRVIVGASTREQELGVYFIESSKGPETEEINLPTGRESSLILTKRMTAADTEGAADKFYTLELTFKKHNIFTHLFQKIKGATVSLLNKK
jgi:hypothetical protein